MNEPKIWPWNTLTQWRWLESTRILQARIYGYNLSELKDGLRLNAPIHKTEELAKYIDWNTTAAVQELAEVREEFSWKPWATDDAFVHKDRVLAEVIDCMHFLGNILVGMGVTDKEWEAAYKKKQRINQMRHDSGTYSAKKGGLDQGSD